MNFNQKTKMSLIKEPNMYTCIMNDDPDVKLDRETEARSLYAIIPLNINISRTDRKLQKNHFNIFQMLNIIMFEPLDQQCLTFFDASLYILKDFRVHT